MDKGTGDDLQKAFDDSIGVVLTYLDEANVGLATKRAVKAELWLLRDKKVVKIINSIGTRTKETPADEENFNR